ncbi:MAG: hypothetical protein PHS57_01230 [Alphaproteobacteria bacterium]|nr:hypothetical protein [Alphaproteobacteria bacterium]
MFGPVSSLASGLQQSVAQVTQVADRMVNASSMGKNLAEDMVALKSAETNVKAAACTFRLENDLTQRLVDILA